MAQEKEVRKELKKDFTVIGKDLEANQAVARPSLTYWQDAWRRFRENKLAVVSLIFLVLVILYSIIGSWFFPDYKSQSLMNTYQPPGKDFWFGTDELGRDLFARLIRGTKISLFIGLIVSVINMIIGIIFGGICGYYGGKVDMVLMRIIEILMVVPDMLVMILLLNVMRGNVGTLIFALCLTGWTDVAQLVRGQVMQLKQNEYVLAARVLGADSLTILKQHLIPNMIGPLIIKFSMNVPGVIFAEASLSYLGLGVKIPEASWGNLAQVGANNFPAYLWLFFIPASLFALTMLAFNLIGDGLRDALDPKLRR